MLCITKELDEKIEYIEYTGYKKDEVLFFDIETTGFSPQNDHFIYDRLHILSAGQADMHSMVFGQ